ncbi:unnamed protein product [Mytilus edulis]|uniref:Uncharacterized protein n=1 Tax=Mytilus edulis TaxID=6550 RepID=A0A8S3VGC4_MYTED|nr:unnamed protein product [Mytilus edulis]
MTAESANGLQTLVDPVAEDVKVVTLLNDFISHLLETAQQRSPDGIHGNQKFLCHTLDFLTYLQYYYSRNAGNSCLISDILSQLRQLLVIVSETVYVSASSCVCVDAVENVITVPTKTKCQLRELTSRVDRSPPKTKYLSISEEDHLVAMTTRSKQVIDLLEGCEILLSAVSTGVKEKATSERRFFNTSSITIGAICAGRLAWQLFKGVDTEQLITSGIWAGSIGVSAVVLQVPRLKMSDVLNRLEHCEKEYEQMKKISKNWKLSSEWSYSRLVRLPPPTNGIRFSLN